MIYYYWRPLVYFYSPKFTMYHARVTKSKNLRELTVTVHHNLYHINEKLNNIYFRVYQVTFNLINSRIRINK